MEHDISVVTGCYARSFFAHHNLICVYIDREGVAWKVPNDLAPYEHSQKRGKRTLFSAGTPYLYLLTAGVFVRAEKIDCAVNCCHGGWGENGSLSGLLNMCNIPQAQCNVLPSAIFMNKAVTKSILQSLDVKTLSGAVATFGQEFVCPFEFPVVVKPLNLGSSIGVGKAQDQESLQKLLTNAFYFDKQVLVEPALEDLVEVNCSALRKDNQIKTSDFQCVGKGELLTFDDKYQSGDFSSLEQKVQLTKQVKEQIADYTKTIYQQLNCDGVLRVDYFVKDQKVYCNEVNTIPGSLAYGLWKKIYTKKQFGEILLNNGISRFNDNKNLCTTYASNVLDSIKNLKK